MEEAVGPFKGLTQAGPARALGLVSYLGAPEGCLAFHSSEPWIARTMRWRASSSLAPSALAHMYTSRI